MQCDSVVLDAVRALHISQQRGNSGFYFCDGALVNFAEAFLPNAHVLESTHFVFR